MRINIDLDKKPRPASAVALENFLNYHLIRTNHGITFDAIFVTFFPATSGRMTRVRHLYKKYADIFMPLDLTDYSGLTVENVRVLFDGVISALDMVKQLPLPSVDFDEAALRRDLKALEPILPSNKQELTYWFDENNELRPVIHLKRMDCREQQRRQNRRPLIKPIKAVRFYDDTFSVSLRPYLNFFGDCITNELKSKQLLSPAYTQVYFSISDSIEQAKQEMPLEDWQEYTYMAIDYTLFQQAEEKQRFYQLYQAVSKPYLDLADIDGLDRHIVSSHLEALKSNIEKLVMADNFPQLLKKLKKNDLFELPKMNR